MAQYFKSNKIYQRSAIAGLEEATAFYLFFAAAVRGVQMLSFKVVFHCTHLLLSRLCELSDSIFNFDLVSF